MAFIQTIRRPVAGLARRLGFRLYSARSEQATIEALADFEGMLDLLLGQAGASPAQARGQLKQDIAAFVCNGFKRNGYFVDIGAAHPEYSSNTVMLERAFGWDGICAEANPHFHDQLRAERRCNVDTRCVWSATGETLSFHFTQDTTLSTLSDFVRSDHHAEARAHAAIGTVETVSLNDLLKTYGAPRHIDFLSIDTEGSELAILEAFDFSATSFGFICVEHNYAANRDPIRALLERKGYRRIWKRLSAWDDWYVPIRP